MVELVQNYDIQNRIFYVIYQIVCFMFNCYEWFREILEKFQCRTFLRYTSIQSSLTYLIEHGESLKAIPDHLAVIVTSESISFVDLAKILVWCQFLLIDTVSLFDAEGEIKSNLEKIISEFKKMLSEIEYLLNDKRLNHKLKIRSFDKNDGYETICEMTKNLCESTTTTMLTNDMLDSKLKAMLNIEHDPDLAVVFGPIIRLNGFLPWQIRLTEFFRLRTHRNLNITRFFEILSKYQMCQKRFGK